MSDITWAKVTEILVIVDAWLHPYSLAIPLLLTYKFSTVEESADALPPVGTSIGKAQPAWDIVTLMASSIPPMQWRADFDTKIQRRWHAQQEEIVSIQHPTNPGLILLLWVEEFWRRMVEGITEQE